MGVSYERGTAVGGAWHPGCDARLARCPVPSPASEELSATQVYELKYEPSSESLHISAKWLFVNPQHPRNVKRFRGGLVFEDHRLLHHSD